MSVGLSLTGRKQSATGEGKRPEPFGYGSALGTGRLGPSSQSGHQVRLSADDSGGFAPRKVHGIAGFGSESGSRARRGALGVTQRLLARHDPPPLHGGHVRISGVSRARVSHQQQNPAQRTTGHLATWFMRVMIGAMWFQGSIWKLPLPVSGGFRAAITPIGEYAAFEVHRWIAKNIFMSILPVLGPLVYLTEPHWP